MPAPTTDPYLWGSDATWTSGDNSGQPVKDTLLSAVTAAQGFVSGVRFDSESANQMLHVLNLWAEFQANERGLGWFGDGSDGNVTVTGGTTTLTSDMYYNDLTVTSTGVLDANGYRIFVAGTLTIEASGVISNNGSDGEDGSFSANPPGGAGGSIGSIGNGGGGADGVENSVGDPAGAVSPGFGGTGGAGGAAGGNAGGAAGVVSTNATAGGIRHAEPKAGTLRDGTIWLGGSGGGSGGSSAVSESSGAGGGGGGVIVINARAFDNSGSVQCNGGAGGDGDVSGGGGGGGGGGVIVLTYRRLLALGTVQALGGAAGLGAGAGSDGSAGSAGLVLQFVQ